MISIRPEQPGDAPSVHSVNELAFGQPTEAILVDKLRIACPNAISLVAVIADQVVGHILFTPAHVADTNQEIQGMGLAPMSVLPDLQRQRIGSQLVKAGLEILRQQNCPFVIVLGHPEYYPRFGFVPASRHGLTSQWPGVPDEAFMVLIFDKLVMSKVTGMAMYRDEFNEAL